MFTATPTTRQQRTARHIEDSGAQDVIETRLWLDEHDWLYRLLRSEDNVSPTFRFPDLISASVSLVFTHQDAPCRIFRFLGTELVLRSPETPRRRESMWRHQYQLLLDLQRSPANRHPNPKFQLDQLTTAASPYAGQRMARAQVSCGRPAATWPNVPIPGGMRRPAEAYDASTGAPDWHPPASDPLAHRHPDRLDAGPTRIRPCPSAHR